MMARSRIDGGWLAAPDGVSHLPNLTGPSLKVRGLGLIPSQIGSIPVGSVGALLRSESAQLGIKSISPIIETLRPNRYYPYGHCPEVTVCGRPNPALTGGVFGFWLLRIEAVVLASEHGPICAVQDALNQLAVFFQPLVRPVFAIVASHTHRPKI